MSFCLPSNYKIRKNSTEYADVVSSITYQPLVYELAKHLARKCDAEYIIDIGCGSGKKLSSFINDFKIIGVDAKVGLDIAKKTLPGAKYIEHDLEEGVPNINTSILERSVVICSDVIEHLRNPQKLMSDLASISKISPYVLISTPDRDRVRGWLDEGPPLNPSHVMEWSGTEFVRFMKSCGFNDLSFFGHTINTDFHLVKTTLLIVSGSETIRPLPSPDFKVSAVLHVYNEEDIIPEVVNHLYQQGVEVHIFDNWSNDSSWQLLLKMEKDGLIKHLSRFPEAPRDSYDWQEQLIKTTNYAKTLNSHWVIHYDADELRFSPWKDVCLRDAIARVDQLGYNAIDFTVLDFRFLESNNDVKNLFESSLNQFEFGRRPAHFIQIKAWKNDRSVELSSSGGHEVIFHNRRVYPLKFLTKHYPLRNSIQSYIKIHKNRLPRITKEKEMLGWHGQYDKFQDEKEIRGWKSEFLLSWHPTYFMNEYIVERLSGIGL